MAMINFFGVTKMAAGVVVLLAIAYPMMSKSIWAVGYDLDNCLGCQFRIDWSHFRERHNNNNNNRSNNNSSQSQSFRDQFQRDGVVVLPQVLLHQDDREKLDQLFHHVQHELPNTIMTDVVARFTLPHYLKYEHRLDTRSELIRDWALQGPLATWAAQLLLLHTDDDNKNSDNNGVRLYNVEAIYHKGEDSPIPCRPAWHRDTIAAPFSPEIPSVTFNLYFEDIGPDAIITDNEKKHGDGLIYLKGSHHDLTKPPPLELDDDATATNTNDGDYSSLVSYYEPTIRVGDILAHNPNVYHTPSGKDCWKRRSLQFRYVAARHPTTGEPTTFQFDSRRWPHGPIPWSLAHSPQLFPHGLKDGDVLQGPGYPLVHPHTNDDGEHRPLDNGSVWTLRTVLAMAQESQALAAKKEPGFYFLDGPLRDPADWEEIPLAGQTKISMLMHKDGPGYKFNKKFLQEEVKQTKTQ